MQSMANTTTDPALGGFEAVEPVGSTPNEELRVLEVIPGNGDGAAFVFARRQVASLAQAGVKVRSFYLPRGWSPQLLFRQWMRLRREIREFRPALVHAHYGSLTALFCAAASTVPLIVTLQGSDLNDNPEANPIHIRLAHLFSHIACFRAKRVIVVSEQLRTRLFSHRRDAAVIPTGIDMRVFRPMAQGQARRVLGWPEGIPIVFFHSGGRPALKGAHIIEPAVRAAEETLGPIRLMDLNGNVPCELVPYWINAADCVALASISEGSPNVVKEALACNVPVVATDVGDVGERLRDVEPSQIVRRDVAEFKKALANILRQRRRSNGREKVGALDEPCIAQAVRAVYESALKDNVLR
jgi:glycosyltransferase involved in cell wall biosynthesis